MAVIYIVSLVCMVVAIVVLNLLYLFRFHRPGLRYIGVDLLEKMPLF